MKSVKDPTTKLAKLLQAINVQQARSVMQLVRLGGEAPDLSGWAKATAEVCKPLILALWQQGMVQAAARIAAKKDGREIPMPQSPRPSESMIESSQRDEPLESLTVMQPDGIRTHRPGNESIFGERLETEPPGPGRLDLSLGAQKHKSPSGRTSLGAAMTQEPGSASLVPGKVKRGKHGKEDENQTGAKDSKEGAPEHRSRRVRLLGGAMEEGKKAPGVKVLQVDADQHNRAKRYLRVTARHRVVCTRHVTKAYPGYEDGTEVDFSFDLFNPRVLDAVDEAVMAFCKETLDTATGKLTSTLDELRELMKEGLGRGEAVELLAGRVRTIFADPMRAFRIAATEGARAVHGGQMMAAKEVGVSRITWLASSDGCPSCLELDGQTVNIGEPFYVDPRGGKYAVCYHPPLHPMCMCSVTEEFD